MKVILTGLLMLGALSLLGCQTGSLASRQAASRTTDAAITPETCVMGQLAMGCQTAYTASHFNQVTSAEAMPEVIIMEDVPVVVEEEEMNPDADTPVAMPTASAPLARACDRTVVAKSAHAVGDPCMTTQSFIQALALPPRQAAQALTRVEQSRRSFTPAAAH